MCYMVALRVASAGRQQGRRIDRSGSSACDSLGVADYITPALERWRRATDVPLLVLAIGSLPLLILELFHHDRTRGDDLFLFAVNLVVLVAFAVDYVVELTVANHRRSY